jgi:hypothetical protein
VPLTREQRVAELVAEQVGRYREELAELVARAVDAELERVFGELVAVELERRNGARPVEVSPREVELELQVDEPPVPGLAPATRTCRSCGRS